MLIAAIGTATCAAGDLGDPSTGPDPTTTDPTTTDPTTTDASAGEGSRTTAAPRTVTTIEPAPATSTTAAAPTPVDCLSSLSTRRKVALLTWPAVYSDNWDQAARVVHDHQVGGVVLMKPSGWSAADVTEGLELLDTAAELGLLVATDEEGGDVQRLTMFGELPSQQAVSESMSPSDAQALIARHGARIGAAGVDIVFGPVVDVVPADGIVPLQRSRFFSGEPAVVSEYAAAYVEGWNANGITPVLKHFPGHGSASGDTHDTAGVTSPLDELTARDLVPYADLAGTDVAVMVGHLTVPGLTDGEPATRSARAIEFLRTELGYADALVISDALGMNAVGLSEPQAAVAAIAAGIDVAIFTATEQTGAVVDAIERAVLDGTLPTERLDGAARRVLNHLEARGGGCATP